MNSLLNKELQTEIEIKRATLERRLGVTLRFASRNLPLRDKTKDLEDIHNGNFLGTLELLSHYDPLLKEGIQAIKSKQEHEVGKGTRLTHYLSSNSQNEFVDLCADGF